MLVHFYHAYVAGAWQVPVAEHLDALRRYQWEGPIVLGLVGPRSERRLVRDTFKVLYDNVQTVEAKDGWEQHTIHALHQHAAQHDGSVFYAHTKGATNIHGLQDCWRQTMTHRLLNDWRRHASDLDAGRLDAVGCHWTDAAVWPDGVFPDPIIHFAGNFWMASCAYLRRLPRCEMTSRWEAERWLGQANPRVENLLEGWPNSGLDTPPLGVGRLQVTVNGQLSPPLR